jgi:hypothetical protein
VAETLVDVRGVLAGSTTDLEHRHSPVVREKAVKNVCDFCDDQASRLLDLHRKLN